MAFAKRIAITKNDSSMPATMPATRRRPSPPETARIAGSSGNTHGVSTEAAPPSSAIAKRYVMRLRLLCLVHRRRRRPHLLVHRRRGRVLGHDTFARHVHRTWNGGG